ncbi:MAG: hypothetical protein D6750_10855 [Bacteroidetes bacterium]|nr:MAG: hypothetical protein D6750_10855 [Bacteroidota bacterium]
MILTPADIAGRYRLPAGVASQDVLAAIRQLDLQLLRELFDEDTVQLIAALPAAPPATTLAAGGGGLGLPWRDFAVSWAGANLVFAVVGSGAQSQSVKNFSQHVTHTTYTEAMHMLAVMRERLQRVSALVWKGRVTVLATTPTDATLDMPLDAVSWCRPGLQITVGPEVMQVVSLAPFVVQAASHSLVAGEEYFYVLPFRLRMPKYTLPV